MSSQLAEFVDAVAEAVALHGDDEQRWMADWSADFDEAQRDGDHEAATLLVDTLVAFNAWLSCNNPTGGPAGPSAETGR